MIHICSKFVISCDWWDNKVLCGFLLKNIIWGKEKDMSTYKMDEYMWLITLFG